MPYKNEDGTIPAGLKIDIMRHCMENKELLLDNNSYTTYVGTGNTDSSGVAITSAFNLSSYVKSIKDSGSICNIISSDIDNANFNSYSYNSILTLLDENTVVYSSSKYYIGIRPSGDTYIIDDPLGVSITSTNALRTAIANYKVSYPDGEAYAFDKISSTVIYYYDNKGIHSVTCSSDSSIISNLQNSLSYGYQDKPNLYKQSYTIYELSVHNAVQIDETEQFSSLRGMFGVMGGGRDDTPSILDCVVTFPSAAPNTTYTMYAGLLRFDHLRFITIKEIDVNIETFSLQKTYFVLDYGGGCDKILYTEQQFITAKNKNYIIYEMPKFDKDNLYFMTALEAYSTPGNVIIEGSHYEFLDIYSDYNFIKEIKCRYSNLELYNGVNIGYFSSDFKDSNYISLGYTTIFPDITQSHFVQFESSIVGEESPYTTTPYILFHGYETRYIIVGYKTPRDNDKDYFHFSEIKKVLHNSETPKDLTSSNPHYMVVFKVVERNTTT